MFFCFKVSVKTKLAIVALASVLYVHSLEVKVTLVQYALALSVVQLSSPVSLRYKGKKTSEVQ